MNAFNKTYDSYSTYELTKSYIKNKDEKLLNEILCKLAPLVSIVCLNEININDIFYESVDGLKCDSLHKLYELLNSDNRYLIPLKSHRVFTAYMRSSIKRSMIDAFRYYLREHKNIEKLSIVDLFDFSNRFMDYHEVDYYNYFKHRNEILLSIVRNDCRYKESEVCEYIAKCLLEKSVSPMTAKFKFKIPRKRVKLLHDYVKVLLESAIYYFKSIEKKEIR